MTRFPFGRYANRVSPTVLTVAMLLLIVGLAMAGLSA